MRESDINLLCRLCLNKSFFYSNIYIAQALEGIPFYEDINYVYDLKISSQDGSPEYVCQKCFEDVNDFKLCKINAHTIKSQLFHLKSKLSIAENHVFERTNVEESKAVDSEEGTTNKENGTEKGKGDQVEESGTQSIHEIFIKEEPVELSDNSLDEERLPENEVESQECQVDPATEVKAEIVDHDIPSISCENEVLGIAEEMRSLSKSPSRGSRKRRKKICQMSGCCGFNNVENSPNSTSERTLETVERANGEVQALCDPFLPQDSMYVCSMCSMAFPNKLALTQHLYTHSEGAFVCGECSISFPNKVALTQHLSMHLEGTFVCGECSIAFPNKDSLTQHLASHSSGTFICGECGVAFPNKLSLVQHHCVCCEGTFECEDCSLSFPNKVSLTQHLCGKNCVQVRQEAEIVRWKLLKDYPVPRMANEGEELRCEFCNRSFAERSILLKHEIAHYEGRDYTCTVCGKQFLRLKNLRRHEMVHKVDRPHQCSDCDKRFQDLSSLRRHEKIHKGIRPYHCMHCAKEFFRNDHLISHMRVHLNERPFRCELCGKGFTERSTLKRHQRLHHPVPIPLVVDLDVKN